ncbi:MAG: SDR family NAD(P)-dependent oxidoreductase, partial [Gemmatimonadota bacterium]
MSNSWDKEIDPAPIAPLTARQTEEVEDAVEQLLEEVGIETEPRPLLAVGGLRGRGAIVTGASRGIGRAVALELARHGVSIAFNYIESGGTVDREEAETVAAELREMEVNVFCRRCDVRDPDAVRAFVTEAHEELGPLHILVNNAGIGRDSPLWRMSDEEWKAVVQTNLSGTFYFIRAVAPLFRAQEYGKIVNISSVHGVRSEFGLANYSASKAGIIGLTQSAAVELGRSNVNVNAVAPGYIRTTRLTERVPAEILDRARERSVLGRLGDPQDVAGVVLFLCSEAARHITGAVIPIDGG